MEIHSPPLRSSPGGEAETHLWKSHGTTRDHNRTRDHPRNQQKPRSWEVGRRGTGMWFHTCKQSLQLGRRVIQGVDACQRFHVPVLWRPYLGRQCGGRGGGTEPQHRGVVQPGYSWPVQEVGFFAAGLPEGEVGKAPPDSSEGSRGPGTCRAVTGFEICQGWGWAARAEARVKPEGALACLGSPGPPALAAHPAHPEKPACCEPPGLWCLPLPFPLTGLKYQPRSSLHPWGGGQGPLWLWVRIWGEVPGELCFHPPRETENPLCPPNPQISVVSETLLA